MPFQLPASSPSSLPVVLDPIDERFALDPLSDSFTEEVLLQNAIDLRALFRVEIEEYNRAQERAKAEGTKVAGVRTKKAQKARLSVKEQALLESAKNDAINPEDLF
jgi:hypothetical protein